MVTINEYEKASGNSILCSACIHRGICIFSKDFKKFENEIEEKKRLLEYQEFTVKVGCNHYNKEQATVR